VPQHTCSLRFSYTRAQLPSRFTAWFAVWVCAVVALGIYVHWPSVSSGFRSDDFPQRAMLTGEFPSPRSAFDLFNFASGTSDDVQRLSDFGYLPWWTDPNLQLRMWRPLASALAAGDRALFGDDARKHHLHSLAWYALLCAIAGRLYRRWLTWPAALVAVLAFALEEGHTVPIGWLANRNTLIATALGLLALELHVRFREGAGPDPLSVSGERDVEHAQHPSSAARGLAALGTALCTGLALLAGEYAFTALAYVFAYEALRREPLRARLRGALPVLLPALAYLIAHTLIGSDVVGSGYYISPVRAPLAYAEAALVRIPALFADLTLGLPADWFNTVGPLRNEILSLDWFSPEVWQHIPSWPFWNALIGYGAIALAALIWRRGIPRVPPERRRGLSVLALGSLLALLPSAGSLPGDRLIVAAAFGVSGLLATLLVEAFPLPAVRVRTGAGWVWRRRPVSLWATLAFAGALAVVGPLGVPRVWKQATDYAFGAEGQRLWSLEAEMPERDSEAKASRVYLLSTADFTTATNLPFARLSYGLPLPRSYRRLCPAMAPIDVRRTGERSLEIVVLTSDLQGSAQPSLYRSAASPIEAGHRVRLPGLDVSVLQARDGNPALMRFDFDLPLEDPRLWFLESSLEGLRRIDPPAVGATLRLPRPHYRDPRFAAPR
jgi:hypothetical protein